MRLDDFIRHPAARTAELQLPHVSFSELLVDSPGLIERYTEKSEHQLREWMSTIFEVQIQLEEIYGDGAITVDDIMADPIVCEIAAKLPGGEAAMRSKMCRNAFGMIPRRFSSVATPIMLHDLPQPVWPYAKIVPL